VGIRLIVEVLDHWKDLGLTAGERDDLVVIAENANEKSRETFGPIHEAYILKRVNKSAAAWRIALNRLLKKKALEYAIHNGRQMKGFTGQHAIYRIPVLCPDPPHDGWHGHCTRPPKDTASPQEPNDTDGLGYLTANPATAEGYPSDNPVGEEGYLTATERVSGQITPSPPTPLTTSPLSVAERVVQAAAVVADDERETFINWINQTYLPQGPGWWRTVAKEGDFPDIAARWRASTAEPSASAGTRAPCPSCPGGEGWIDHPEGGVRRCPECNPGEAA
jgi:hypothetical protein